MLVFGGRICLISELEDWPGRILGMLGFPWREFVDDVRIGSVTTYPLLSNSTNANHRGSCRFILMY